MKNPVVSVVIPVRNGEKTLPQCLRSVLHQTYRHYEVIIVDNNSADRTKHIIFDFYKENKKIKYVFESRIGRSKARNTGVKKAKGSIIVMTDADCVVPPDWIERITKPVIYENESVVIGFEKDLVNNYWTKRIQKEQYAFFRRRKEGNYIAHIDTKNFAINSSLMRRLAFDEELGTCEDFDLYLRIKGGEKVRFLPSLRVGHWNPNSLVKVIKSNFSRGYNSCRIYKKMGKAGSYEIPEIAVGNFLMFPFWVAKKFFEKSVEDAFFIVVYHSSWRVGVLLSIVIANRNDK